MKIMLSNLPMEGESREMASPDYLLYDFVLYPPLGLLCIAAGVDRRHSIEIIDVIAERMNIEATVQHVIDRCPDVLGLSAVTRRLFSLLEVARKVKAALPNTKIVAGGPHINYYPLQAMKLGVFDYLLPGYGEETFPKLIEAIDKGERKEDLQNIPNLYYMSEGKVEINTSSDSTPTILDSLPFPKRELLDLSRYFTAVDQAPMTTMYSSRGCPFKCTFCDVQEKKYRWRSPSKIVDEFEEIKSLGFEEVFIFDDTFNLSRKRVIEMCHDLLNRKVKIKWAARVRPYPFDRDMLALMKKAGCSRLHIGVESLDDKLLEEMNKKITLEQIENFFANCNEIGINT